MMLRDRMPPSVLSIDLEDAHESGMPMAAARATVMRRPAAPMVTCISASERYVVRNQSHLDIFCQKLFKLYM